MTHGVRGMVLAILLLAGVTPGWAQQQYLYAPKPVAPEEKVQKKDGILVQEIAVRKGDTLYAISRAFSGHGSYYPQILLFNDIKDPDRIYPGNLLRIPVSRRDAAGQPSGGASAGPAGNVSAGVPAQAAAAAEKKRVRKHAAAAPVVKHAGSATRPPAAAVDATTGQMLFERAVGAYRQDDCRTALQLFDSFLAEYPASALAADASLYKAECYLKQSGQ